MSVSLRRLGSKGVWRVIVVGIGILLLRPGHAVASEPAVAETNFRAGLGYLFTNLDDDSRTIFPSAVLNVPESESHQVALSGGITVPVAHAVGLRASVVPSYSHQEIDGGNFDDVETGGIALGGDVFARDPELFEVGAGLRYAWSEVETSSSDDSLHSLSGVVYAKAFVRDYGVGPVDLGVYGQYGEDAIDEEDRVGGQAEFYEAGGGVTFYPHARVALAVGGHYRSEESSEFGDLESEISTGVISIDFLALRRPALTVGPRFEFGEAETSFFGVDGIEQDFYSVGFGVSASFPGADSLVELSRKYY